MSRELTGETIGEVKAVAGMHQRKAEMAKHSDAFIALPGGYGTLEELLEVITWAQLGIHEKPVIPNCSKLYHSQFRGSSTVAFFSGKLRPFCVLKVGLLNFDGYSNSLLSFIDKAVEEGFTNPSAHNIIVSALIAKELVKKLEEYVHTEDGVNPKLRWDSDQYS